MTNTRRHEHRSEIPPPPDDESPSRNFLSYLATSIYNMRKEQEEDRLALREHLAMHGFMRNLATWVGIPVMLTVFAGFVSWLFSKR